MAGDDRWSIRGVKDCQLVKPDWSEAEAPAIAGVVTKAITNVLTDRGYLTEIWRADWNVDGGSVGQVFQRTLEPGAVSAWHAHRHTTDRIFCGLGRLLLALFDARKDSPSHGVATELRLGAERPALVVTPPGIWHGVRNVGSVTALLVNVTDAAYDYEDPDHERLPPDTPLIPYRLFP